MASRSQRLLTDPAIPIAQTLAKRVGSLKLALSAGIMALNKLSADEREKSIAEANGLLIEESEKKSLQDAIKTIKEWTRAEREQPGIVIKILGPEGQAAFDEFRRLVGPEPKKTKQKKKSGG